MPIKYNFKNDYSEGAHPAILKALASTNDSQETGYGEDSFSLHAAELIRQKLNSTQSHVHFVSGGTQANLIVLASLLRPYEAVIAPNTGHISVHEAGAIEATGHKIIAVPSQNGKLTPNQIKQVVVSHDDEHMVQPKVVFISHSTEVGTIYSKQELADLAESCKTHNLYLYLDGARIGSALTANGASLELSDIASLTDIFYIGGTKNGALLGEAIVVNNPALQPKFRIHLKQRGALLAKGRVLGLQFQALFTNDLFFELAKHANQMASRLTEGIKSQGFHFLTDSPTNQIFPILPNSVIQRLEQEYGFYVWSKDDINNSAIRLVTSWATPDWAVDQFLHDLKEHSE